MGPSIRLLAAEWREVLTLLNAQRAAQNYIFSDATIAQFFVYETNKQDHHKGHCLRCLGAEFARVVDRA